MQSWISNSPERSVLEETGEMIQAADNKRRIMGSTIFGSLQPETRSPVQEKTLSRSSPQETFSPSETFPDITFDPTPPLENLHFDFKPKVPLKSNQVRRLEVPPNLQMKQLRDDLNRDTEAFSKRVRKIGLE